MTVKNERRGAGFFIVDELGSPNFTRTEITVGQQEVSTETGEGAIVYTGTIMTLDGAVHVPMEVGDNPTGILWADVDTTEDDAPGIIVAQRAGAGGIKVRGADLIYPAGASDGQKATINTALLADGIIVV